MPLTSGIIRRTVKKLPMSPSYDRKMLRKAVKSKEETLSIPPYNGQSPITADIIHFEAKQHSEPSAQPHTDIPLCHKHINHGHSNHYDLSPVTFPKTKEPENDRDHSLIHELRSIGFDFIEIINALETVRSNDISLIVKYLDSKETEHDKVLERGNMDINDDTDEIKMQSPSIPNHQHITINDNESVGSEIVDPCMMKETDVINWLFSIKMERYADNMRHARYSGYRLLFSDIAEIVYELKIFNPDDIIVLIQQINILRNISNTACIKTGLEPTDYTDYRAINSMLLGFIAVCGPPAYFTDPWTWNSFEISQCMKYHGVSKQSRDVISDNNINGEILMIKCNTMYLLMHLNINDTEVIEEIIDFSDELKDKSRAFQIYLNNGNDDEEYDDNDDDDDESDSDSGFTIILIQ